MTMLAPFFVELLHRTREVRHRYRVDGLPITLGRGYDNTVILDDPHASAHHALIDRAEDGSLVVRDLDSRNGIVHKGTRRTELPLDGDTVFRLGHTSLRVRSADFPVESEITDGAFYDWEGWPPAAVGLALVTITTLVQTWAGDADKFELTRYIIAISVALGLGMFWSGGWSFANRLFGGNTRLGRHLFIFGCGFVAIEAWEVVSSAIAYALSFEAFTRYGSHIQIALLAAMVFYHLLQINPVRSRLFAVVGFALSLLGSGVMLLINYSGEGRLADEHFMSERFPPAVRLSADRSVAQFINSAGGLKAKVDAQRSKLVGDEAEGREQE
jgi:hypothetical protein